MHSLAGPFAQDLTKLKSRCRRAEGAFQISRFSSELMQFWKDSLFCGCKTEVLTFLLAVSQRLLSASRCHLQVRGSLPTYQIMAHSFEASRKTSHSSLLRLSYNHQGDDPIYHHCHISVTRRKTQVPSAPKRGRLYKGLTHEDSHPCVSTMDLL